MENILPEHGGNTPPKPDLIPPNFDNVPEELKQVKWAVGKLTLSTDKDGAQKWTKAPRKPWRGGKPPAPTEKYPDPDPIGCLLKKDKPHTWLTYQEMRDAWDTGEWDFVGFLIESETDLTVIDLDNIDTLINATGEGDMVATILGNADKSGVYWERSISGTGIHAIFKSRLAAGRTTSRWGGHETGGIELYGACAGPKSNWFMTFSGAAGNQSRTLVEHQGLAEYALERIITLRGGTSETDKKSEDDFLHDPSVIHEVDAISLSAERAEPIIWAGRWEEATVALSDRKLYASASEARLALVSRVKRECESYGVPYPRTFETIVDVMKNSGLFTDEKERLLRKYDIPRVLSDGYSPKDPVITDPEHVGAKPEEPQTNRINRFPGPFPGFMADTVEKALAVAHSPQPDLTMLSVLIAMASACDGTVSLPDGGRLNLYGLGVAESAAGKDAPLKLATAIAYELGAKVLGSPASGQGLEDALVDTEAMFAGLDEVGHLLQNLHGKNAQAHHIELAKNILTLYSRSNGTYITREKAVSRTNPKSRALSNPCLNLLAFTTPASLSNALTSESIASGLLGRFLFVEGDADVRQRLVLTRPKALIGILEGKDLSSGIGAREIQIPDDVEATLRKLLERLHKRQFATERPDERILLRRSLEKILRIAGVLSVWDNPNNPTVSNEHLDWAERVVEASNSQLLTFCADRLHDDPVTADAAHIRRCVREFLTGQRKVSGERLKGLLKRNLVPWTPCLRQSKLGSPRFDAAIRHAVAAGMLEVGEDNQGKKMQWIALPEPPT